jgi:OHCU decarboxylase
MKEAGWEIASHGTQVDRVPRHARGGGARQLEEAIRLHAEVTGERPRGWYLGRCSMNTVRLAAEEGGFDYISDSYADDLPYWIRVGDRDQLIIPYTLDANDMRFATPQGFNSGDQFEAYLRDSFDALYAEGRADDVGGPPLPPDRPPGPDHGAEALHGLCRRATRRLVPAPHRHRPPLGGAPPAAHACAPVADGRRPPSSRPTAASSSIRRGSPKAHGRWNSARPTTAAEGLHNVLTRVFRAAPDDRRLGVLAAHPDLAGKLAQAKRLTEASTAEQASAGLDALTDAERAEFTRLNDAYTATFGFPFIIAVRDNTKASILAAFRRRLGHDRATEFAEACAQVERIAWHRLKTMLP